MIEQKLNFIFQDLLDPLALRDLLVILGKMELRDLLDFLEKMAFQEPPVHRDHLELLG